ncbi:MAG: hypothetical protein BZY81_09080 [SAR202 cluster bacterium Io17-Chloro-G4]|nr:MAG: hypothetical protein BZY81_09080 [SAR202 cluster bacterium Io17-Chloro-G4]
MKRALLFNSINPKIGGVLIRGKKGTAKSTTVRSLAALLPEVTVVRGCPYSCAPEAKQGICQYCEPGEPENPVETPAVSRQVRIVDLPVGATEDRLVGSLDIETAIKTGDRSFEPGLIAATHRGVLYIDEVNLLNDHLVDVLLDASAMGRNYVEREGISISHSAEFILVGTMNPEEGDLRPQLLDRFGLAVEVEGTFPPEERREVVRRRIAYEADPFQFMEQWQAAEQEERDRLSRSRELLPQVRVPDDILNLITDICAEYQVDGMRGDIVMYKTAGTVAAYEGRTVVTAEDVREAANLALLHRQRRQPFQQPNLATDQLDSMVQDFQDQERRRQSSSQDGDAPADSEDEDPFESDIEPGESSPGEADAGLPGGRDQDFEVGDAFPVQSIELEPPDNRPRRSSGRRSKTLGGPSTGRYVGARTPQGDVTDLALDATLRVAAPHQVVRRQAIEEETSEEPSSPLSNEESELPPFGKGGIKGGFPSQPALLIRSWDVREKIRETKTGTLILFVVDASGSMAAQRRMVAVKGAVNSLLMDAYQRRDRVGLVSFRGTEAKLLLPPTSSVELAQSHLAEMPTGGRTPLGQGLYMALQLIETERLKDQDVVPLVVLLSDGRANVPLGWTEAQGGPLPGIGIGEEGPASTDAKRIAAIFNEQRIHSVVVDTEVGVLKFGMAKPIAAAMGAQYIQLDDLGADNLAQTVRLRLPSSGQSG